MRTTMSILAGLMLFSAAGSARGEPDPDATPAEVAPAQPTDQARGNKLTLGLDAAAQIPVSSDLRAQNTLGLGGLLRVELNLIQKLNLTLRGGYVYGLTHHLQNTFQDINYKTSTIPAWIGGKYFVTDMIYGALEVGYDRFKWSYDGTLVGVPSNNSGTANKFGGTVGAGVLIGPVDAKAQLEVLDINHASNTMAVMINVGYDFLKLL